MPISSFVALQAANKFRGVAAAIDTSSQEGQAEYDLLRCLIRALHWTSDELDPLHAQRFSRQFLENPGHGMDNLTKRNVRYRCSHLLNCFLMADLLRTDAKLKHALEIAMRCCLPRVVADSIQRILEASDTVPSKASLSRWRFLVDVAYLLYQRDLYSNDDWIHSMMVDASKQHNRHFELIYFLSVLADKVIEAVRTAKKLVQLRLIDIHN